MKILRTEKILCPCCMEEHFVKTVSVTEQNTFKTVPVDYMAEYYYCDQTDEFYADEKQVSLNDLAMKDAYRKKTGLLTADQIIEIRSKYGISQTDLCLLLGWGGKTITRYEGHQVQDMAHDTILRKVNSDPEWFLQLLHAGKRFLSDSAYKKYLKTATTLFEQDHDMYLRSAILSKYIGFFDKPEATGKKSISIDVVTDMIRYYSNSLNVTNLFLVKLMKMLWYADALSYKRYRHSISGLAYCALPMGAVPIAYETIIDISTINYKVVEIGDGIGYKFLPTYNKEYPHLTPEDISILDTVIQHFGKASKADIVETMHQEDAYKNTRPNDIIQFKYTQTLSLS